MDKSEILLQATKCHRKSITSKVSRGAGNITDLALLIALRYVERNPEDDEVLPILEKLVGG